MAVITSAVITSVGSQLRGGKFTLWEGGIRGHAFISGGLLPPGETKQHTLQIPLLLSFLK